MKKKVIVNHAFHEQKIFTGHNFYKQCHFKRLPNISSVKLKKPPYHALIRMFKMSDTIRWDLRNRFQYKTQQPHRRCSQKRQYTSIKPF